MVRVKLPSAPVPAIQELPSPSVQSCPFCELQLDLGQVEIQKHFGEEYTFDVMHVVELLALAFGHEPDEFGLATHLQYMQRKSTPAWEKLGIKVEES